MTVKKDNECTVGVDLGGTNIKVGLVDSNGKLLDHFDQPTGREHGPDRVMENILDCIGKIISRAGERTVNGIGLGTPGAIDPEKGYVMICAPNIPGWGGRSLRPPIKERFSLPAWVDNDAKCWVMGEAIFGSGAGKKNLFVMTLGTGIGGGVVLGGRIHRGSYFCAGEIGHAPVQLDGRPCACGKPGHLESFSSATGIVSIAAERLAAGENSSLTGITAGELTSKHVFDAAKDGDRMSLEIVTQAGRYIGMALASYAMVVDPEMIVIGGGVALAGDILFDPINESFDRHLFYEAIRRPPIVLASLGFEAGMVGAATMAMLELGISDPGRK